MSRVAAGTDPICRAGARFGPGDSGRTVIRAVLFASAHLDSGTSGPSPRPIEPTSWRRPVGPLGIRQSAPALGPADRFASPNSQKGRERHAHRPHRTASIGALGSLDPERGLARTLQQVTDGAHPAVRADAAGLMLIDAEGRCAGPVPSDQTAQTLEDEQERLAQGPCAVAFSQRLSAPATSTPNRAGTFAQVLLSESISAALSVPVELDGGVIGTLDIYVDQPRDWDPSEVAALQAYAGLVASLLSAAVTAQVKGRLADRCGRPGAPLADRAGQGGAHGPRRP